MVIQEAIEIDAPMSVVWSVFSCLEEWETWNSVCRSSNYLEGEAFSTGTCISFTIHPFILPIRISPRITTCIPGRELTWEGERLGIHAAHTFTFREERGRVILTSIERFRGLMVLLSTLLLVPSRLHELTRELLKAVKREAEARFKAQTAPPSAL